MPLNTRVGRCVTKLRSYRNLSTFYQTELFNGKNDA